MQQVPRFNPEGDGNPVKEPELAGILKPLPVAFYFRSGILNIDTMEHIDSWFNKRTLLSSREKEKIFHEGHKDFVETSTSSVESLSRHGTKNSQRPDTTVATATDKLENEKFLSTSGYFVGGVLHI
jgi:hypothetical protein